MYIVGLTPSFSRTKQRTSKSSNMTMRWQYKAKIMKACAILPAGGYLQVYSKDVWQVKGRSDGPDSCANSDGAMDA